MTDKTLPEPDKLLDELLEVNAGWDADPDWMIQCDCCQEIFTVDMLVAEEGDRWECFPCWERLNAQEAINHEQSRDRERGGDSGAGTVCPDGVPFLRGRDVEGT
jgi:hypothetical protein